MTRRATRIWPEPRQAFSPTQSISRCQAANTPATSAITAIT